jgi:hypothetical protein
MHLCILGARGTQRLYASGFKMPRIPYQMPPYPDDDYDTYDRYLQYVPPLLTAGGAAIRYGYNKFRRSTKRKLSAASPIRTGKRARVKAPKTVAKPEMPSLPRKGTRSYALRRLRGRALSRRWAARRRRVKRFPYRLRAWANRARGRVSMRRRMIARTVNRLMPVTTMKTMRGVKPRPSKVSMYGGRKCLDIGGTLTSPDSIYIGHATCHIPEMRRAVARAVVRKLARKAGIDFRDWRAANWEGVVRETSPTTDARFTIVYDIYSTQRSGPPAVKFVIGADNTDPLSLATLLEESIRNEMNQQGDEIRTFTLAKTSPASPTPAVFESMATLNCNQTWIHLHCGSELVIQNVTAAQGAATTNNLIEEIGNNPLTGYYYTNTGNAFYDKAQLRGTPVTPASSRGLNMNLFPFVADNENGLLARLPDSGDGATQWYTYPPNGTVLSAKTINKQEIKPGQQKISKLFSKHSMPMNKFFGWIRDQLGNIGTEQELIQINMGKVAMYGLRRRLDMRVDDPGATIGYQLKWSVGCYCTESRKQVVADITDSSNTSNDN